MTEREAYAGFTFEEELTKENHEAFSFGLVDSVLAVCQDNDGWVITDPNTPDGGRRWEEAPNHRRWKGFRPHVREGKQYFPDAFRIKSQFPMVVECAPERVTEALMDFSERRKTWDPFFEQAEILEKFNDDSFIMYIQVNTDKLDGDADVHTRSISKIACFQKILVVGALLDHKFTRQMDLISPNDGHVPGVVATSGIALRVPRGKASSNLDCRAVVQVDIGGNMPMWRREGIIRDAMNELFVSFQQFFKCAGYKAHYDMLTDLKWNNMVFDKDEEMSWVGGDRSLLPPSYLELKTGARKLSETPAELLVAREEPRERFSDRIRKAVKVPGRRSKKGTRQDERARHSAPGALGRAPPAAADSPKKEKIGDPYDQDLPVPEPTAAAASSDDSDDGQGRSPGFFDSEASASSAPSADESEDSDDGFVPPKHGVEVLPRSRTKTTEAPSSVKDAVKQRGKDKFKRLPSILKKDAVEEASKQAKKRSLSFNMDAVSFHESGDEISDALEEARSGGYGDDESDSDESLGTADSNE